MVGEDLMVALLEPNTIQLVDDSDQTEIASMYYFILYHFMSSIINS